MKSRVPMITSIVTIALSLNASGYGSDDSSLEQAISNPRPKSLPAQKVEKLVGRQIPNFILADTTAKSIALSDFEDARFIVLVFLGTKCPIGNAYAPVLVELQNRFRDQHVQFLGINSTLTDNTDEIALHAKQFQLNFPVLIDSQQLVADLVSAQRISEVQILDRRHHIRYRGRIDDRVGYTFRHDKARRNDLIQALEELVADKSVSVDETEIQGCLITRRANVLGAGEITYAKHVAPILQNRCVECHHPGTAAPFSLQTFEEARDWSAMIKETVVQRRMPPWNADSRYGHFSNDPRLKKEEIDTIQSWVNQGAPLGNREELATPRQFPDGWSIPTPDLVFKMPIEFEINAAGAVEYQYFVTPTHFEHDVWVQSAQARPGNRSVVHHIIAYIRPRGSKETQNLPYVCGYAPGEGATVFPAEMGLKIPAHSEIVWQVHYTPTGKKENDCSELALILCKARPEREVQVGAALNMEFQIPPGDARHKVVATSEFAKDVELLSLVPHMHLRGKDFRYTAQFPDGRREILLNVPNFDFNWQHLYRLAKPVQIPKGTTIECVAHFDNSVENPANPDSKAAVRWGDQTWDEMMIGWYTFVDAATVAADSKN